jgi:hypothetical protein
MINKMGFVVAAVVIVSPLTLAVAKNVQAVKEQVKLAQTNQAEQSVQKIFTSLISDIEQNNYTHFISQGNAAFKEGMTKQMLTKVRKQFAARIKKGYSTVFLGNLNQQGYQVYLWRLTFKDRGDDILATLSLKDGKIGGFWLRGE